jgi:hypothetical protein
MTYSNDRRQEQVDDGSDSILISPVYVRHATLSA